MRFWILAACCTLGACSAVDYRPTEHTDFVRLVDQGCDVRDERFNVRAQVSAAYKETLVLWDGIDSGRTVAVRLPAEGWGSKARGVFGDSRYEVNLETLRGLKESRQEITVSLLCTRKDRAPELRRIRWLQNGEELEIDFAE